MIPICISNLTIIGSDNGLSPGRRQAIIWTNTRILLIGPLGTNFSAILIEIHTFSFKKMHLKMLSENWWPFCLQLNVLIDWYQLQQNSIKYNHVHNCGNALDALPNCDDCVSFCKKISYRIQVSHCLIAIELFAFYWAIYCCLCARHIIIGCSLPPCFVFTL